MSERLWSWWRQYCADWREAADAWRNLMATCRQCWKDLRRWGRP